MSAARLVAARSPSFLPDKNNAPSGVRRRIPTSVFWHDPPPFSLLAPRRSFWCPGASPVSVWGRSRPRCNRTSSRLFRPYRLINATFGIREPPWLRSAADRGKILPLVSRPSATSNREAENGTRRRTASSSPDAGNVSVPSRYERAKVGPSVPFVRGSDGANACLLRRSHRALAGLPLALRAPCLAAKGYGVRPMLLPSLL